MCIRGQDRTPSKVCFFGLFKSPSSCLLVVSCRVVSFLVLSCRVVSCRVVSCRVLSCLVVSWHVVSCLVLLLCRALSCRVLSCLVLCCVSPHFVFIAQRIFVFYYCVGMAVFCLLPFGLCIVVLSINKSIIVEAFSASFAGVG